MLEIIKDIAASLYLAPCTFDELKEREAFKTKSEYGLWSFVQILKRRDAIVGHPDEGMRIKKSWAKENLQDYDLDFRTPKQKWLDSLSQFKMDLYKSGHLIYDPE